MAVLNPLPLVLANWPEGAGGRARPPLVARRARARRQPQGAVRPRAARRARRLLRGPARRLEAPRPRARGAPRRRLRGALRGGRSRPVRRGPGASLHLRPAARWQATRPAPAATWGRSTGYTPSRSIPAEVRLYDRLFRVEQPDAEGDFLSALNPDSLALARGARVEPSLARAEPGNRYQFLRQGYFFADPVESRPGAPVWNRTITLKDTWAARGAGRADEREAQAPEGAGPGRRRRRASRAATGRAEVRAADPAVGGPVRAATVASWGCPRSEADLLAGETAVAAYFDAALAAGASPRSVARWLAERAPGPREGRCARRPPPPRRRLRPLRGARRRRPPHPRGRQGAARQPRREGRRARGADEGARPSRRSRTAAPSRPPWTAPSPRSAAEVDRYRAGEKKLFGVLLGAAMRQTGRARPTRPWCGSCSSASSADPRRPGNTRAPAPRPVMNWASSHRR